MKGIQTYQASRLLFAVLTLLVGIIAIVGARSLEIGTLSRISPGFFPTVFGIFVVFFSVLMITSEIIAIRKDRESDDESDTSGTNFKGISAMIGIFTIYVILSNGVGYILATAVALAGSGYLLGLRKWGLLALVVITSLTTWALFEIILGIRLPDGSWL